ncbi:MAG: class I tRNA ligase family protein, partial [Gammaproteobacteria bacterium]|nr:class I tRNA ligase family protein [Gammaproteobacteria bacterium]
DIIFFWVARMIMFGLYAMDDAVPFKHVYIHGLVRDAEGKKMSKSKGNVLDPLDVIDGIDLDSLLEKRTANMLLEKQAERIAKQTQKEFPEGIDAYGTDALRFTVLASITTGRDVNFDTQRVAGYRNFCNKLWNATRFVMMSTEGQAIDASDDRPLSTIDRWIETRLQATQKSIAEHLDNYRFDLATKAAYDFTWNEFCDWYLELTKPTLNGDADESIKAATRGTLLRTLESQLRLLHPFMPYITESLWQSVAPAAGISGDTIMTQAYPEFDASKADADAEQQIEWIKSIINAVRRIRSEMDVSPAKRVNLRLRGGNSQEQQWVNDNRAALDQLAKLESLAWVDAGFAEKCATAVVGDLEVLIPMAGLIDVEAELARIERELAKIDKEHGSLAGKLANEAYVAKAPAHLIERDRARVAELEQTRATYLASAADLKAM